MEEEDSLLLFKDSKSFPTTGLPFIARGRYDDDKEESYNAWLSRIGIRSGYLDYDVLQVGKYCIIDGFPCKIITKRQIRDGKYGHQRAWVQGVGIFDQQRQQLRQTYFDYPQHIMIPTVESRSIAVFAMGDNEYLVSKNNNNNNEESASISEKFPDVLYLEEEFEKKINNWQQQQDDNDNNDDDPDIEIDVTITCGYFHVTNVRCSSNNNTTPTSSNSSTLKVVEEEDEKATTTTITTTKLMDQLQIGDDEEEEDQSSPKQKSLVSSKKEKRKKKKRMKVPPKMRQRGTTSSSSSAAG